MAQLETIAVKANLVAPVVREGKLLGLLVAHQCSEARVWQQLEIKWLEQLALQLGFALDNATLVGRVSQISQEAEAEAQKHRQEQQAVIKWKEYLKDATQHLYESLEEEEILKASVEEARRVLECDRVVVYSVDRKSQGIIISESVAPGWPRVLGRKIEDPCFEAKYIQKYENGRVRAIDNIYEAGMSQCYIEQLETIAVKANLVAPVVKEGKLLGLLVAHQCSEARVWQQLEINWLEQLAIQLGFALDNATLVGRVAQISQEAEAEAQKHRQEQQALQHQIVKLIKDSQAALKSFESKTLRQSDSVMSVLEGIQAVADSARSLAGSTQQIELQLQQTSKTVEAGYESANRTVDDISRIQETLIEAVEKVKHLSESSQQISQAMSLIKDLAAQMNQQALNTTIEAGRKADVAQESVVSLAETVRFSTQQLTAATAEVEPLIRTMQTEANELVAVMEAKTEKASGETDSIEETRQKLNQIAAISAKMSGLVNKIAHAAAQQTQTSAAARKSILEAASLASKTSEASAVVTESWQKLAAVVQDI
ncbi:MAG: GAF domain-containing protein [Prochloraceae cyanobacterium]